MLSSFMWSLSAILSSRTPRACSSCVVFCVCVSVCVSFGHLLCTIAACCSVRSQCTLNKDGKCNVFFLDLRACFLEVPLIVRSLKLPQAEVTSLIINVTHVMVCHVEVVVVLTHVTLFQMVGVGRVDICGVAPSCWLWLS